MQAEAVQLFPMDNSDNTWRDEVFEFLNDKIDQIIEQSDMEKIEDITGAIFQNKSSVTFFRWLFYATFLLEYWSGYPDSGNTVPYKRFCSSCRWASQ